MVRIHEGCQLGLRAVLILHTAGDSSGLYSPLLLAPLRVAALPSHTLIAIGKAGEESISQ